MKSVEIFLNFPLGMDVNRNILWRNPEGVPEPQIERMNAFWGDDSWHNIAYTTVPGLWGDREIKATNEQVAEAFRRRLLYVAGFAHVTKPMPMRNSRVLSYIICSLHLTNQWRET